MERPIIFLFPGQGSQYLQMGKEIFAQSKVFRTEMEQLDQIVQKEEGYSLINYLYDPAKKKNIPFCESIYSHPAIFMTGYALAKTLMAQGIKPDLLYGVSLGEYTAMAISGQVDTGEIFRFILKQPSIFKNSRLNGGMLSVFGNLPVFENEDHIEVAVINGANHIVLSGNSAQISNTEKYLKNYNKTYYRLPVEYGFHSSAIEDAKKPFLEHAGFIKRAYPKIPVLSCVNYSDDSFSMPEHCWNIIRNKMDFRQAVRQLENKMPNALYVDLGFSGTMVNMAKTNFRKDSNSIVLAPITMFRTDLSKMNMRSLGDC
ncbi:hypothetical protein ADH76_03205 [Enterocloster clostridioformis]|nr:hypothetical protein A4V08_01225 [Lachnoclostridium sp. YL32]NDO27989.1 acyltransferase domain-containing protein [Enterocloster clostridioformis]OXE70444.1 hypothetical protein ADH76_03205 [Enterocloster clostridioformis]QQR00596.1 acyltransferase domain-containing protein [Enterocloster clostridioformis]